VHPASGRHLVYLACRITAVEWCDLDTVEERWAGLPGGILPPVGEYLEQVMDVGPERLEPEPRP